MHGCSELETEKLARCGGPDHRQMLGTNDPFHSLKLPAATEAKILGSDERTLLCL